MSRMPNLKYIIENELFITCSFLSTDQFISYCKDRGIRTSRKQLEQFEKLRIFYPVARVKYPKVKKKVEYTGSSYRDLGILKDGEEWPGDIREEYEHFEFYKENAMCWLEEGLLWEPSTRPFQAWETFYDENRHRKIESFYSIFQCYSLYNLVRQTKCEIGFEWWAFYSKEDTEKEAKQISDFANKIISICKEQGVRGSAAVVICQIISNRYFPKTQSDRRTIHYSISGYYHYNKWDWYEYCRNWDAKAVLDDIGVSIDELKQLHRLVSVDAEFVDPLEEWYELISFISVERRKKLKGHALLAQSLYSMEHMLRLFYEDLTGEKLQPPDESPMWKQDMFYGEGVTQNELQYLEFITNQYRLNPRPKLILVVEGNGEDEQFPRLSEKLFGHHFPRLGIEVRNIHGVGGFEGRKRVDKYGALEKFIDDYHYRQTIVFVVLDNEGRVRDVKNKLLQAKSIYSERTVTISDYFYIWSKSIEFDNFSDEEIAKAMTELCENRYTFQEKEITNCKGQFTKGGDPLSNLYNEKLDYDLSKPKLLEILFGYIISHPEKEFDEKEKAKRPVVQVIHKVINLAAKNHQPHRLDTWRENQQSGYFGVPINK